MLKGLTDGMPNSIAFDQLPIMFRGVATDLVTGEAVVLDRGELAAVLCASMSVPAAFAPVEIGRRLLGDGGLVDNLAIGWGAQNGRGYRHRGQYRLTPAGARRVGLDFWHQHADVQYSHQAKRARVHCQIEGHRCPDLARSVEGHGHRFQARGMRDESWCRGRPQRAAPAVKVRAEPDHWLNSLGAEWRNELQMGRSQRISTELYQPLLAKETLFASFGAAQRRRVAEISVPLPNGSVSRPIAQFTGINTRVSLDLGAAFGRYGEFRVGPRYECVSISPRIADLSSSGVRANESGIQASVAINQRDSATFARSGYRVEAGVHRALSTFGASENFSRYPWSSEYAKT